MQVQAAAAQAAYCIHSKNQCCTSAQETQQQTAPITDTVEISNAGRSKLASKLTESLFPDSKLEDGVITMTNIQEQIEADQAWLNDKLAALVGGDADNYKFTIGTDGHVNVSGGEMAGEIEQAFEDDFEMHNRLARISANSSLMRAGKEHLEFSRAYEIDPEAALARYSYLFNGTNRADVVFEYGENGLDVYIESVRKGRESLSDYLTASENEHNFPR